MTQGNGGIPIIAGPNGRVGLLTAIIATRRRKSLVEDNHELKNDVKILTLASIFSWTKNHILIHSKYGCEDWSTQTHPIGDQGNAQTITTLYLEENGCSF